MSGIEDFYVHTVHVQTYTADAAWGASWDEVQVPVTGFLNETSQLVRDGDGDEVTSTSSFRCRVTDAARFTPESKVTLHRGTPLERATTVITASLHTSGPLMLPDHAEIAFA